MNTANPLKPAKNLVQTIAKQIAQEPWEILKQAEGQVTGADEQVQQQEAPVQQEASDNSERDKIRSQRLMQALQAELDEIKKKKEQEKLLKAQQEQMAKEEEKKITPPLVEPAVKKGRRLFNFGKKTQMQRQQTQTERPLPPSG
jgi:hypothetical protein